MLLVRDGERLAPVSTLRLDEDGLRALELGSEATPKRAASTSTYGARLVRERRGAIPL
ncbi:MAG: hypothetical protein KF850_04755 [Labilithrix sp.]|nr:hypothetical protein [Labilithrix sp.]